MSLVDFFILMKSLSRTLKYSQSLGQHTAKTWFLQSVVHPNVNILVTLKQVQTRSFMMESPLGQLYLFSSSIWNIWNNAWRLNCGSKGTFLTRELLLNRKDQLGWPPCINYFRSAASNIENISFCILLKQAVLLRKSIVQSLPLQ
jgi:hypothetical protein